MPLWLWTLPMTMNIAYDYEHCLWLWTLPMTVTVTMRIISLTKPMPLIRKHKLLPMTKQGHLWLNTYDSWLGKCCLSSVIMRLGLNPIIYSACPWFSLVLDLGNLPIKLGLPMFLNRCHYSTLFMPVSMSIFCIASLVHSLFATNLDLSII